MISGLAKSLKRLIVLFAAAFALPATAGNQEDLVQLMSTLARNTAHKVNFTEKKYVALMNAPVVLSGTLEYDGPDRIEKVTTSPFKERFLVDKDTVTFENPARGIKRTLPLRSHPALWAMVESIRGTLSGNLPVLTRFYRAEVDRNRSNWLLQLEPKDPRMSEYVSLIRISGRKDRVTEIEIFEASGDRSVMTMTGDAS